MNFSLDFASLPSTTFKNFSNEYAISFHRAFPSASIDSRAAAGSPSYSNREGGDSALTPSVFELSVLFVKGLVSRRMKG